MMHIEVNRPNTDRQKDGWVDVKTELGRKTQK